MSRQVETVDADEALDHAATKMRELDIGVLVVIAHRRPVGMVSDRDLTVRATARDKDAASTRIREVMTHGVVTCFSDEDLESAAELMAEEGVRRLLVLDREMTMVGLLSVDDIALRGGQPELVARVLARLPHHTPAP